MKKLHFAMLCSVLYFVFLCSSSFPFVVFAHEALSSSSSSSASYWREFKLPRSHNVMIDSAMENAVMRLAREEIRGEEADSSIPGCDACLFGVTLVDSLLQTNASEDEVAKAVAAYCIYFNIPKDYRNVKTLCEGLVNTFKHEVVGILVQKDLEPMDICVSFKLCDPTSLSSSNTRKITYDTPALIPLPFSQSSISKEEMPAHLYVGSRGHNKLHRNEDAQTGLIYHISDIHTDNLYSEGAVVDCGLPLCCEYGEGQDPSNSSAKWGVYANCDPPPVFTVGTLAYMANLTEVDMFFWTGDNTPHDIWKQNELEQLKRLQIISAWIAEAFPNTQVWPSFGNHDTYPVDQFSFPPQISWLMNNVSEQWARWIPADQMATFKYGGYYVAQARPGLRIVSLNTQWCDTGNFWLWLDVPDPAGQLAWLSNTLAEAQEAGDMVYILGHIPPGSFGNNCSASYYQIINQFSSIVAGQFFGHTHDDQFQMFRDVETNIQPTNVAYIAPAHTGYGGLNPSFRYYEYNRTSFEIVDYTQFHTDLNQVNAQDSLYYTVEYSAKESYSLPDLSPASWENFVLQLQQNDTLFQEYYQRIYSGYPQGGPCEGGCKSSWICSLDNASAELQSACDSASGFLFKKRNPKC